MKKYLFFYIFIALCFWSFGQVGNCENFNNNIGNWQGSSATAAVSNNIPTANNTQYMRGVDGASAVGSWIFNDVDYGSLQCSTSLCWDYKVFNDGVNNNSPNMFPRIIIYQGAITNQVLSATFVSSIPITENSNWINICATLLTSNNQLPVSNVGTWSISSGNPANWNNLISNATGIAFVTDVAGSSSQNEVIGIDNICLLNSNTTSNVDFHFEHENGVEDTVFSICEDVFLDGSQIVNPNGNFFMDLWTIDSNGVEHWISGNGWTQGQPNFVNITDTFENNSTHPVIFQVGVTYQVKLAINDPICGWVDRIHTFIYTEEEINVGFHFEHENGSEDTIFDICEDVFLDGSETLNTSNYFMDIWTVDSNGVEHWISNNGWTQGQPNLVNVSEVFRNNTTHPVVFQAGVTYRVKLAINDPVCGWQSVIHDFTYVEVGISSLFDIVDYNCHDGVYDVTVTTQDSFPSQWWRVYETSVEGQTGDNVTVGPSSGIQSGTTTTFFNLDPNKFYYVKHGVWTANCPWQETRIPLDRDCCIDNPYIEPYWEFCDSTEVCELETWPIRILDANGDHVTLSDGVQFTWESSNGNTSNSDGVYTVPFEEWKVTLVYPDGCVYISTYKKICCEEEVHIEIDECITAEQAIILVEQLELDKSNLSEEKYTKYSENINSYLQNPNQNKADCDPCDDGTVFLRVVNSDGELITDFISIVWSDGLAEGSPFRVGDVNVTYTVTVVLSANDDHDICTYTDSFIYECETDDCRELNTPINVELVEGVLSWDPVPGAVGYIVESTNFWPLNCRCDNPVSIERIETVETNVTLPAIGHGRCFVVQVRAICRNGVTSRPSEPICIGGDRIDEEIKGITYQGHFEENVTIVPNPTKGFMTFRLDANYNSNVTIEIYNHYGYKTKSLSTQVNKLRTNSISWDGSKLEKGIYFINIITNKRTIFKQIVIN